MNSCVYDVLKMRQRHAHIVALAGNSTPAACAIGFPPEASGKSVAVVSGSFNPPTSAHLSLCDGALQQDGVDVVWWSLAVWTVDKEQITGACLEDRLCMLELLQGPRPNLGIVLCNRGLYVEQAEALHAAIVSATQELVFVVGYDKIQQILDARYYADRATSLDRLFSLSRFLVAERDGQGKEALDALLDRKENRAYRARIAALTTLPDYHDPSLSSTSVRTAHTQGLAGGAAEVPRPVQAFMAATGVYAAAKPLASGEAVDRYAQRMRIRDALLSDRESDFSAAEFQAAEELAASDSDAGRTLREQLASGAVTLRMIRKLARA